MRRIPTRTALLSRAFVPLLVGACVAASVYAYSPTAHAQGPRDGTAATTAAHTAHPRELFLAGGSLKLCSSLARKECSPEAAGVVGAAHARSTPRYSLDAAITGDAFESVLDPLLWAGHEALRAPLRALLADARGAFANAQLDEDTLLKRLETRCIGAGGQAHSCRGTARSPWRRLDDDTQAAVLAALELPQFKGDARKREIAALDGGRRGDGAVILRAFVAAARARLPENTANAAAASKPRIAVVTASAFDPFDPVDLYLDALRQAGAEVEWWPVDAALAAAVFDGAGCAALPALRRSHLKLPGRERVYPDLAAEQSRACLQPERLRTLPDRVQGVFFTGGDQWKLRKAFFHRDGDRPNAWLLALRAAAARGDVVIAGTSAGSAVQSGAPMLSNGSPERAVRDGAIASPPPASGCARSGDCVDGLAEDAFTFWPAGGLALAPGIIVDTHFSERAREVRLLRLLADTGNRLGVGIDETSALHLRWRAAAATDADASASAAAVSVAREERGGAAGSLEIRALGAAGGWVFDVSNAPQKTQGVRARGWYLAPGSRLDWSPNEALLHAEPARESATPSPWASAHAAETRPPKWPTSALDDGALRSVAQALAVAGDGDGERTKTLPIAGTAARVTLSALPAVSVQGRSPAVVPAAGDATMRSIGPLLIELQP
jgi:hypothetical protein